jgi:hypothetical protein
MSGGRWGPDWELALRAMGWRCENGLDWRRQHDVLTVTKAGEVASVRVDRRWMERYPADSEYAQRWEHECWRRLWEQALQAEGLWDEQRREAEEETENLRWLNAREVGYE